MNFTCKKHGWDIESKHVQLSIIITIISVPAGVYLFPNPRQRFALRIWPGTIQVSRSG